ncbi:MAG: CopG family transcriptional regulator [Candidatus Aenigmarchaeota archaeon]|nr:CopG family transcriptional regulator [Candidatus Aenigmarchaeota archaeon]
MKENKMRYTTVSIPEPLAKKIEQRIKGTGFNSVTSFVVYVLRQTLAASSDQDKEVYSKEAEKDVKKRLKSLGYL